MVNALELDSVSFSYGRGDTGLLLEEFSLGVADGELVTVIGPSGCGKTTLVKLMAGLLSPLTGHVLFRGMNVCGPSRERGVVFQGDTCFPWLTVWGNVTFSEAGSADIQKSEILIRSVGLWNNRDSFPSELSFGMRQRVALARALAAGAEVLLLDEPLSALDAMTRSILQRDMKGLICTPGRAALWVTHDLEEALLVGDRLIAVAGRPLRILTEVRSPFAGEDLDKARHSHEMEKQKIELYNLLVSNGAADAAR